MANMAKKRLARLSGKSLVGKNVKKNLLTKFKMVWQVNNKWALAQLDCQNAVNYMCTAFFQ